jgi:hypothetical protein
MQPEYVNVMEVSELAYVMLVYVVHAVMAAMQAALAAYLLFTGGRSLLGWSPEPGRAIAAVRACTGGLLLAPLVLGLPVLVSILAGIAALGLLAVDVRGVREPLYGRRRIWASLALAGSALLTLFMVWEREDNLALGVDLITRTIEFRNEEVAWQTANDAQSPKVGDIAPDFELEDPDGVARIRLSDYRGKRPVALVFGSYT